MYWIAILLFVISVIPVINDISVPSNGTAGGTVELTCNATGYPLPVITWLKNNTVLMPGTTITTSSVVQQDETGLYQVIANLSINGLILNDTDVYSCVAKNQLASFQSDVSRELQLTVLCKSSKLYWYHY